MRGRERAGNTWAVMYEGFVETEVVWAQREIAQSVGLCVLVRDSAMIE